MTDQGQGSLESLAALAVRFRMLSEAQLQQAQQQGGAPQILVDLGMLSDKQLNFLKDAQAMKQQRTRDIKFGQIAVVKNYATEPQIDSALKRQKEQFIKQHKQAMLGDILVDEGVMTAEQRDSVIQIQQQINSGAVKKRVETAAVVQEEILVSSAEGVQLIVSKDGLRATLSVAKNVNQEGLVQHIEELLSEYGVVHGLVGEAAISAWLEQGEERTESLVVARGTAPIAGHGGKLSYYFDTDPLKAGKVKEGGVIDFKDRGEIPQVDAGTVLAELSEPDPGTAGTDIHGEIIPPPAVKETKILSGNGVIFEDDGKRVVAEIDGSPSLAKTGAISVFPLYNVEGNVGYKTGHVDFDGDIQVSGTIEKDFSVKGGRLSAMESEGGDIEVKGDVVISGGIIGGHIKAGGNVMAAYIHNATLEVDGDVLVQKEIRGCDIKAGGGLYSDTSIVLDSRISAKAGINAGDIGSDVSPPSRLAIGSDALLELRIAELKESIKQQQEQQKALREKTEAGKQESQQIDMEIPEIAQVQDRSQVEQRELAEERQALEAKGKQQEAEAIAKQIAEAEERAKAAEKKLDELFGRQDEIADEASGMEQDIAACDDLIRLAADEVEVLEQQMEEEQADVLVKVSGTIYPMTTIATAHTSVKTKQPMKELIIRETARRNEAGDEVWKIVTESIK